MSDRVSVTLTGPAKIGGRWRKPGDTAEVTSAELGDLIAAGAAADGVDIGDFAAPTPDASGQDLQVQLAEATKDRDEWRALQQVAENQIARLEACVLELEDDLNKSEEARKDLEVQLQAVTAIPEGRDQEVAAAAAAAGNAPKTAPKKGAGGKKG